MGIPDLVRGSVLSFITNLQAPTDPTGWGRGGTSNNNWGVIPGGTYIDTSVAWGTTVPAHPDYMSKSLVNPRAAASCVRDYLLC